MTTLRRYAWVLGLVGALLVAGFAVRTALLGGVDDRARLLAIAAAASLVGFVLLDRPALAEAARRRDVRIGAGSLVLTLASGGVVLALQQLVTLQGWVVDVATEAGPGLSPQSRAVLDSLEVDVQIDAFAPTGSTTARHLRDLLDRVAAGRPRVQVTLDDALRAPLRARTLGVEHPDGEIIVRVGDAEARLASRFDEDALVDAIVRLANPVDHRVCWSTDHGEVDPDDRDDPQAWGALVLELEGRDHEVVPVTLDALTEADCDALIIARPAVDLDEAGADALVAAVERGLSTWVALEPGRTPGWQAALARLGVTVGADVVLDAEATRRAMGAADAAGLVVPPAGMSVHPIVAGRTRPVLLSLARRVDLADGTEGSVLLRAGPASWAETDLETPSASWAPDDHEVVGDVPLAVAATLPGGARLVVTGDASFAANRGLAWGANRDLASDTILWILHLDRRIGARHVAAEALPITAEGILALALGALVVGPGLAGALGVATWWRRRRL